MSVELSTHCNVVGLLSTAAAAADVTVSADWLTPGDDVAGVCSTTGDTLLPVSADWLTPVDDVAGVLSMTADTLQPVSADWLTPGDDVAGV